MIKVLSIEWYSQLQVFRLSTFNHYQIQNKMNHSKILHSSKITKQTMANNNNNKINNKIRLKIHPKINKVMIINPLIKT